MRHFRDAGVGVICVFDGPGRVDAKARERERRAASHRLNVMRAALERERLARLTTLSGLLAHVSAMHGEDRSAAWRAIQMLFSQMTTMPTAVPTGRVRSPQWRPPPTRAAGFFEELDGLLPTFNIVPDCLRQIHCSFMTTSTLT